MLGCGSPRKGPNQLPFRTGAGWHFKLNASAEPYDPNTRPYVGSKPSRIRPLALNSQMPGATTARGQRRPSGLPRTSTDEHSGIGGGVAGEGCLDIQATCVGSEEGFGLVEAQKILAEGGNESLHAQDLWV